MIIKLFYLFSLCWLLSTFLYHKMYKINTFCLDLFFAEICPTLTFQNGRYTLGAPNVGGSATIGESAIFSWDDGYILIKKTK